ncbi:MAG: DUF3309 family protein [Desulfatiglandaceae bacterium]
MKNVTGIVLIVILAMLFVGVLPTWSHSSSWGPVPSGGIGLAILIVLKRV